MTLAEDAATRLGFRSGGRWARATRVLSSARDGSALLLDVATDDPLGGRLAVRLAPDSEGVISLTARADDAEAVGIGFGAVGDERYLGFGERPERIDHRGVAELETYVADGPYQPEERPFLAAFVPTAGFRFRDDATYFPVPWLLSTRGYGVLVDNTEIAYHRLAGAAWSVEVTASELRLRVFAGPRPRDVLRRLTARLGRQPEVPPWVFGPWYQPGGSVDEQVALVKRLRDAGAPLSVAQTYLHYLPCGDHVDRREEERRRTALLHGLGVATTTYFNPMVCTSYAGGWDPAAMTKTATGEPYLYRYSTSSQFLVGQIDFSADAGRSLLHRLLAEAVEDGHDGWMEDFGEYTPLDSRSANGMTGMAMHNLYPVQYHCSAWDFARRQARPIVRFQRSGFTGAAPCAQVVWNGDPTTDWDYDGLASAVKGALSLGLSGVSTWGSDIGGFFALGTRSLDPELLARWVQFGAFSPVMRTQRDGIALPEKERPQVEDDDQLANWRRYARLHTQLYPYIAAAHETYRRTGVPIMRHLALHWPDDEAALAREDEYMFGPDLLVAPVLEPGVSERRLYVPPGEWVDFWRSVEFTDGPTLRRAALVGGGREHTLPAPPEEIPLLVRAGAIIPLVGPEIDTLAAYDGPGITRLADRRNRLHLLAFPRGKSGPRLAGGPLASAVRLRSHLRRSGWRLAVSARRRQLISLQASLAFRPCSVRIGARRVRGWRYDRAARVLTARFSARRATLDVRRRC
jgi:alpha-glucosidase (family GH31 glycosyl hydrolase)